MEYQMPAIGSPHLSQASAHSATNSSEELPAQAAPAYAAHIHDRIVYEDEVDNLPHYGPNNPPLYSHIDDNGDVRKGRLNADTLPIATNIDAARKYAAKQAKEAGFRSSVETFEGNEKFTRAQRRGLQKLAGHYAVPAALLNEFERLAEHRIEFIFDNSSKSSATDLKAARTKIYQMAQFLQFVPHKGIWIRPLNGEPFEVKVDEKNPEAFLATLRARLNEVRTAGDECRSLAEAYEDCVTKAVSDDTKTMAYVFTSAKPNKGRSLPAFVSTQGKDKAAKEVTKLFVNRPAGLVPTVLIPNQSTSDQKKIDMVTNIDQVCSRVNTMRSFNIEQKKVQARQSNLFPFTEGIHLLASLLGAVDPFWDRMGEGRIFGKAELERLLGVPISDVLYKMYFDKAFDAQFKMFRAEEQEINSAQRTDSPKLEGKRITSTKDASIKPGSSLGKAVQAFRKQCGSEELENRVNKICTEENIPIRLGMELALKLQDHHLFLVVDNSKSMRSPSGKTTRMEELKTLFDHLAPLLEGLPNKGVTLMPLDGPITQYSGEETSGPDFKGAFLHAVDDIEATATSSPLNQAFDTCQQMAQTMGLGGAVYVFTDGRPNDPSPEQGEAIKREYSARIASLTAYRDRSFAKNLEHEQMEKLEDVAIRRFVESAVNRPDNMPLTLVPRSNNKASVQWLEFVDQVCKTTNTVDDSRTVVKRVRNRQGPSFPIDAGIYKAMLLGGGMSAQLDRINDNHGIYSRRELEEILGFDIADEDYDRYFDEAYARQCVRDTEKLAVRSVGEWGDFKQGRDARLASSGARQGRWRFMKNIGMAA
jgi:hypothetical protein